MSSPALFPAQLLHTGWLEVKVPRRKSFLRRFKLRYLSPYDNRLYKLHKALRKEMKAVEYGHIPLGI